MANKNLFTQVQNTRPKKSAFDLTHDHKTSCNMGDLVPVLNMDCIPGDKIKVNQEALVRLAPMVAPMMHRCDVTFHTFFVPYRLLWKNWENFITQTKVANALPAFPFAQVDFSDVESGTLPNYLGLPVGAGAGQEKISLMDAAAYQLIWNEFYRDQNLQAPIVLPGEYLLTDGMNGDFAGLFTLRKRAWEHDYFTSALPFAQKGDPVQIPIGEFGDVPVKFNVQGSGVTTLTGDNGDPEVQLEWNDSQTPPGELYADTSTLSETAATTINDLRRATKLQEWLEKKARGGSRYAEFILSMFGVKPQDYRLQRPEYVGGSKTPIQISEVLNMTGTEDAPQGNMAGHGISAVSSAPDFYRVSEHGMLMTIMSVMPKTAYQQGIPKHMLKINDPFEYYFEQFANIGEQPILRKELYGFGENGNDVFGYTPRYSEYKYMNNRVSGEFATTLNFWHMGRILPDETAATLNAAFIQANPTHRVFAVTDPADHKLWIHVLNRVRAVRPMPYFGTPTF